MSPIAVYTLEARSKQKDILILLTPSCNGVAFGFRRSSLKAVSSRRGRRRFRRVGKISAESVYRVSAPMTGSGIPVVDIGDFRDDDTAGKDRVAKEVTQAFENVGFMTIVGHGFPRELVAKTRKAASAFFELPVKRKLQFVSQANKLIRGYLPVGGEAASLADHRGGPAIPDLKEAFSIGPVDVTEETLSLAQATAAYAPNLWPESPADFRVAAETYYREMELLVFRMLKIFAYALELPEQSFATYFDKHSCLLRMQNYPEQEVEPEPGQLRIGEHTDYGAFTLVNADDAPGGLQVLGRSKEWIDVIPAPDSFVVNISDMMMTWTNDRWISNTHRVVNPPRGVQNATRRLAIVSSSTRTTTR